MLARLADRVAIAAIALAAVAVIGPALLPWNAFVSVSTTDRVPLQASLPDDDLAALRAGANHDTGDQIFQVLPERFAFFDSVRRGEWPLWWREAGGGLAILGEPGSEVLEPRVFLLTLLLGEIRSQAVLAVLSVFVLGALTYLYLRLRDLGPLAALTGAAAFALAGATSANAFYSCKFNAYVLLPGGLAAIELFLRGRRGLGFALLAACAADSALAGFPQNTAASAYALAVACVLRAWETRKPSAIGWIGAAAVAGLAVGAIHWLPTVEVMERSPRGLTAGGSRERIAPAHALGLLAPLALDDPTSAASIRGNPAPYLVPGLRNPRVAPAIAGVRFTEACCYAGLAALPLALAGLARGRRIALPLGLGILGVAIAAGTPFASLPGLSAGAPARAVGFASFFLAVLAAEGMEGLARSKLCRALAAAGCVGLLVFAGLATRLTASETPESIAERASEAASAREGAPGGPGVEAFAERWREVERELDLRAVLAAVSAAAVALAAAAPRFRAIPIAVLAFDLVQFGHHVASPRPMQGLFVETPVTRRIRDAAEGGRVARVSDRFDDFRLFQTTLPSAYGISDVSCYVPFPDRLHGEVAWGLAPESIYESTYIARFPLAALDGPLFDLMGVSVVLTSAPIERPDLERVLDFDGFHAYRRARWLGRAWIASRARVMTERDPVLAAMRQPGFDPSRDVILDDARGAPLQAEGGGAVEVRDVSNREVAITVRGTRGGFLVEPAPSCDGWTATVDGKPAPLLRANHAFRAVAVPPGDHEVRFVYFPRSAWIGALVSAAAAAAAAFTAWRLATRP